MTVCEHDWVLAPFYITAAATYEEPVYYPPSTLVKVDHCTKCGLLRLPDGMRSQTNEHLVQE